MGKTIQVGALASTPTSADEKASLEDREAVKTALLRWRHRLRDRSLKHGDHATGMIDGMFEIADTVIHDLPLTP